METEVLNPTYKKTTNNLQEGRTECKVGETENIFSVSESTPT